MSNELPQVPTEMCEPVYIRTSNIGKRVSTKKYKQSWHVFFGYYRFGRIKRMRTRRYPRILHLEKRLGKIVYSWTHGDIFLPINRWLRH